MAFLSESYYSHPVLMLILQRFARRLIARNATVEARENVHHERKLSSKVTIGFYPYVIILVQSRGICVKKQKYAQKAEIIIAFCAYLDEKGAVNIM